MKTSISVVFLQDWAVNAELDKFFATRARAILSSMFCGSNQASESCEAALFKDNVFSKP